MGKRKWTIIAVAVVVIAAGGMGFVKWRAHQKGVAASAATSVRTATVELGTLASSVDASGDLQSSHTEVLYNKVAGKVASVMVKPGQAVKAGQVLVKLTSEDAELALSDAKDNLSVAKSRLATAQSNYAKAPKTAEVEVQKARQDLLNARLKLDDLLAGPKAADVEQAKAALRQAQINLRSAQNELDTQAVLYKAGAIAKMEYQSYVDKVAVAEDNVRNAQIKLDSVMKGADSKEIDAAKLAVQQAEANLKMAEDAQAKAISNEAVVQAEAEVRNATKALATAQENIASLTLKAPVDGIVLAVNATVGKELPVGSANSPIVTLAATNKWQVVAYVDESDIAKLAPGQRVEVTLSAMEDKTFTGRLSAIGGEAKVSQSIVSYPIYVDLDTFNPLFRPGMSADAVVQVVYKPNVLLVPDSAIVTRRNKPMVQVPAEEAGGEPTYVQVEVGLKGDGFTEITKGLEAGQRIILPGRPTTGASSNRQQGQQGGNNQRRTVGIGGGGPNMMFIGR